MHGAVLPIEPTVRPTDAMLMGATDPGANREPGCRRRPEPSWSVARPQLASGVGRGCAMIRNSR